MDNSCAQIIVRFFEYTFTGEEQAAKEGIYYLGEDY